MCHAVVCAGITGPPGTPPAPLAQTAGKQGETDLLSSVRLIKKHHGRCIFDGVGEMWKVVFIYGRERNATALISEPLGLLFEMVVSDNVAPGPVQYRGGIGAIPNTHTHAYKTQ